MAEQKRKKRQEKPKRKQPAQNNLNMIAVPEETHKDDEQHLLVLDAAVEALVKRCTTPTGQSVVAGEQQPHQTKNPLTDEVIVKRFVQTSGE